MTDNEIIKALECCGRESCNGCPYRNGKCHQGNPMIRDALDLINRQKAEIERLTAQNGVYETCNARKQEAINSLENSLAISKKETKRYVANYETIKADAVKEFAEKLKQCMESYADDWCWIEMSQISFEEMVDLLVKEFRRGKKHD